VFTIAVSCGDEQDSFPTATDAAPVLEISDAVHMGGNEDFFFLPPMVPDPSDACDPGEFDGTLQPVVEICQLGLECVVGTQPSGFPIVYSMTDGPGSETVRVNDLVDDLEKNYIVNWHTNEFGLLDTETYRVSVYVGMVRLGYADVKVYASAQAAKNANTGMDIALKDGRTLPIKFRIEHGAVMQPVIIAIAEAIAVQDAVSLQPPVAIEIQETITVADAVELQPAVSVGIVEAITVTDHVQMRPSVTLGVVEAITVTDQIQARPAVAIQVIETITVSDQAVVLQQ
jgi:hypothetical protein